jgi:mannose-1-phosphate guanylyltransferase
MKNIIVVKANFIWDDVGSWQALERHFIKDKNGNVVIGDFTGKDSEQSIIVGDHGLIATMGIRNLIIVQTKDVTLVLAKDKAADLKEFIKLIAKGKSGKKYL